MTRTSPTVALVLLALCAQGAYGQSKTDAGEASPTAGPGPASASTGTSTAPGTAAAATAAPSAQPAGTAGAPGTTGGKPSAGGAAGSASGAPGAPASGEATAPPGTPGVAPAATSVPLRSAPTLRQPSPAGGGAVFLRADRIEGESTKRIEASGNAELRSHLETFEADWISYDAETEEIHARGNVRMRRGSDTIAGPEVRFKRNEEVGFFAAPRYELPERNARGSAGELLFTGPDRYTAREGTYTSCRADDEAWFLRVGTLEIDRGREVGTARNATVVFQGVPILYAPYLDFPLTNERKSGFLTPSLGTSGKRGFEFTVPYYWNIAPNYDATITPRVMARRGVQLAGQFRYLFATNVGEANVEVLPNDRVTDDDRYAVAWKHNHDFGRGFAGYLNVNKVSDDTYFSDLGERISVTSQTTLPREAGLAYSSPSLSALARVQRFQTLQDPATPILPPYERVPQVVTQMQALGWHGVDLTGFAEYVSFRHPTLATGDRFVVLPAASWSARAPAWTLTARGSVHATHYELDQRAAGNRSIDRAVPIFSVDGSVALERDWRFAGQDLVQTLEPRAFYVYAPFRAQSTIPSFDSAIADLNFAQLFAENRYVGHDRINDANQMTLALTSRLLDAATGEERFRMAVGQRFHFTEQRVTLSETPRTSASSDIVVVAGGRLFPGWLADFGVQLGTETPRLERFNGLLRYQPSPGRVLSASYRYSRELIDLAGQVSRINQTDLAAQWPLWGNLAALARWNYSFFDNRTLEGVAGVEYNGDCWVLRVVGHRIATTTQSANHSVFVQLELNGLSRIGTNPLELLRRSIPGYATASQAAPGSATGDTLFNPRF